MKTVSFNHGPRVLVVDDHRISRLHTVQALRQIVSHVKQTRTAQEAMHYALKQLPELIFMDVHLADSNGMSLVEDLRQSWPPKAHLPAIVVLTGDNSRCMREQLEQASVSAVLIKPVQARHIRNIAVQLLQLDLAVRENPGQGPPESPDPGLHRIFLDEMAVRLPELDRCMTNLDWDSARHILHQLIASSAMCRQKDLEQHCRTLFSVLDKIPQPLAVAEAYYPFLQVRSQMKIPVPPESS